MNNGPINWTATQRLAIETAGCSLLVSAAAGSGKTAVLAERCAYLICDAPDEHRCRVDELLVVTFTNAAAAEMRVRIEQAMRRRAAQRNDPHLREQLMLLQRASISTIHSFCASVLRRHFNLVNLVPNFRTLDAEEAQLLRLETVRRLLADRYETDTTGQFQKFVDDYADGDDEQVLGRIIRAHGMLCSTVDPQGWLSSARAKLAAAAAEPVTTSEMGRELASLVNRRIDEFRDRCVEAVRLFQASDELAGYVEFVNEMIAGVDGIADAFKNGGFDALSKAMSGFQEPDLPRTSDDVPNKKQAKKVLDDMRDELKRDGALFELCRFTAAEWREGMRSVAAATDVLVGLINDYAQRYADAKRQLRALDFSDLEELTLKVLRAPGETLAPSPTARGYHTQFKHVLVDEYQDINEMQDAILKLLSRECICGEPKAVQNLFCVGDVKQSIYRFRMADPQRFLSRSLRLRAADRSIGQVIDLQQNFRSRHPLLEAVNCVFQRLMTQSAAEIEYGQIHHLHPGREYPPDTSGTAFRGAPMELHLLPIQSFGEEPDPDTDDNELELTRAQREATLVAERINELIKQQVQVAENGVLRPIELRDIAILLRAMQNKADQFADVLRAAGIAVHSEGGTGFFDSMEIRDMMAMLSLLDNRQQDVPLAALLRCPIAGLADPDDAMARIRLAYPGTRDRLIPFHRAAAEYARTKRDELAAFLNDFFEQLDDWRALAQRRPLAELLWTIYDSTGYLAFCAGLHDGTQRVANLVQLHERARQFGSFQRQGLRRFIRFLQSLRDEQDLAQPSTASEAENAVRVMSIHRSKGLEFPVVIIPDLGKRHNLQDTYGAIMLDRDAGIGLLCVDEKRRVRYPSMSSVLVQERLRRQSLAEEMRVLYVAMTRAREHLILFGTCWPTQLERWRQRWSGHEGPIPAAHILRGASLLDWIGPVAAATEGMSPAPFEILPRTEDEIRAAGAPAQRQQKLTDFQQKLARLEPLSVAPVRNEEAQRVRDNLTQQYAHEAQTKLPASRSVGAITKLGRTAFGGEAVSKEELVRFGRELPPPRCAAESLKPSQLDIGSATHLVLQHLDFSRPCTNEDLTQQAVSMVERKLVAPLEVGHVDLAAIEWLMTTPLGASLRQNARKLRRELRVAYPANIDGGSSDPLDRVMVRGRIDVMIPTDNGMILIDYKTDRLTDQTFGQRAVFYREQMTSYAAALAGITGKPVEGAHLVFLSVRRIVEV